MKLKPDIYTKNIYTINYNNLKKNGIKVLLFDLDNTIIDQNDKILNNDVKNLFNSLKKDFYIAVVSDTIRKKKVKKIRNDYDIEIITNAIKPTNKGFKQIKELEKHEPNKVCMIGDQLLTDVWSAKRRGYMSILVDCISKDIEFITGINRLIEKVLFKKYKLKRGNYYE